MLEDLGIIKALNRFQQSRFVKQRSTNIRV
jgi:hypothetical protein